MLNEIKNGRRYAALWFVEEPVINAVFRESFYIKAARYTEKAVPPLSAVIVIWYFFLYHYLGSDMFWMVVPAAVAMLILFAAMPYTIYIKLGKKSMTPLIQKHKIWYQHIAKAISVSPVEKPDYMELARVLSILEKKSELVEVRKKLLEEL